MSLIKRKWEKRMEQELREEAMEQEAREKAKGEFLSANDKYWDAADADHPNPGAPPDDMKEEIEEMLSQQRKGRRRHRGPGHF
jgi:hypothetical protein